MDIVDISDGIVLLMQYIVLKAGKQLVVTVYGNDLIILFFLYIWMISSMVNWAKIGLYILQYVGDSVVYV